MTQMTDYRKYYIAYGSNLNLPQMNNRCPDSVPVGTAVLKDWELVFRFHATIEPKDGASVPVVIWAISDIDERRLDRYEGFPKYYRKEYMTVPMVELRTRKRREVRAMVYIMVEGHSPVMAPSGDYYNVIAEGYEHFKLNDKILWKALDESIFQQIVQEEQYKYGIGR